MTPIFITTLTTLRWPTRLAWGYTALLLTVSLLNVARLYNEFSLLLDYGGLLPLDKLLHLSAYFLLCTLWLWAYRWPVKPLYGAGLIALGSSLFGLAMEGFQCLIPYRSFEWTDAFFNTLGALGAVAVAAFLVRIKAWWASRQVSSAEDPSE